MPKAVSVPEIASACRDNPEDIFQTVNPQLYRSSFGLNLLLSYLKETMDMRNMLNEYMDFVEGRMKKLELWKGRGLDVKQEAEVTANVHDLLANWLSQCRTMGEEIFLTAEGQQFTGMKDMMNQIKSGILNHAEELLFSRDNSDVEKDIPADAEQQDKLFSGTFHSSSTSDSM